MDIHPQILIFGGSLIAILALYWFAACLKLGGEPVLSSQADAEKVAGEAVDGFKATDFLLDAEGKSALVREHDGRIMLIKRHGNRFAGRVLDDAASAEIGAGGVIVRSGQTLFGSVVITNDQASSWAEAINRLNGPRNA